VRTIEALQDAGSRRAEGGVLWLGRRDAGATEIMEAYVPECESESHRFWIPAPSMAALMRHLRETDTYLAAQVHSHPDEAFHSDADDEWAIVRHLGALSLVVPHFAAQTTPETFLADIAAFALNADNRWIEVASNRLATLIQVT
jgi:hypothetical protein